MSDIADVRGAAASVKPKLRGWLHAATSPLSLACGVVLVTLAPTGRAAAGAAPFALTAFLLFTTSAIYHRGHWTVRAAGRLKKFDHANIFLLIAGSYTPFAVLALHGTVRVELLLAVWVTAMIGATLRVLWVDAPRWSYVAMYLGLGWAAAFVVPQLVDGAGIGPFLLVVAGGLLYTAGGLVYGMKRPNPSPHWFGFHEVFHACTVAAFMCQYVAASLLVYRAT